MILPGNSKIYSCEENSIHGAVLNSKEGASSAYSKITISSNPAGN